MSDKLGLNHLFFANDGGAAGALGELLDDLVAVHRLVLQQAEDREFEHLGSGFLPGGGVTVRYIGSIYRYDISIPPPGADVNTRGVGGWPIFGEDGRRR